MLTASDYVPGDPITTAELLRDVLANEDAVYLHGTLFDCHRVRAIAYAYNDDALATGTVRRAVLRCPQTAAEMRAQTAAQKEQTR